MQTVWVKKLRKEAILPARATKGSAGYDLYACIEEALTIEAGETVLFPTGIALSIGDNTVGGFIYPRSGLSTKHNVSLPNGVGVIDSDYRGEIMVGLTNYAQKAYRVEPQERIAQLVFMPICLPVLEETQTLDETKRGIGGYGSTGR